MPLEQFAQSVAAAVFHRELADARALGYEEREAFIQAFRAMDESYLAVFALDRPLVMTRFRASKRAMGDVVSGAKER